MFARPPECTHAHANELMHTAVCINEAASSHCDRKQLETRPRGRQGYGNVHSRPERQIVSHSSKNCETHKVTDSCHMTQRLQLVFFPPFIYLQKRCSVILVSCWFGILTEKIKTKILFIFRRHLKMKPNGVFLFSNLQIKVTNRHPNQSLDTS